MKFRESYYHERHLTGFGFSVILTVCVLTLVGVALAGTWKIESRNCAYAAKRYNSPTKYDKLAGCYIKYHTRYVSLDQYVALVNK